MVKQKTQTKSKKRKKVQAKKSLRELRVFTFFFDERFRLMLSLFLVFFAAFLVLAFVSYLFTWKIDQSRLDIETAEYFFNSEITVDNWAGKLGAALSDLFIHRWFGIASFAFVFLLVILSFHLINIKLLALGKTLKYTLIAVIWFSITMGWFFGNSYFYIGGSHGWFLSEWLNATVGKSGTAFVLLISLFTFILFTVESSFTWLKIRYKRVVDKLFGENFKPQLALPKINYDEEEADLQVVEETEEKSGETTLKHEFILHDDGKKEETDSLGFEVEHTKKEETVISELSEKDKLALEVEKNKDIEADKISEEPYDPTRDLSLYRLPPVELLENHRSENSEVTEEELIGNKNKIVETLKNYKIDITKIKATIGPTITLYEIIPAPGVRISKIKSLEDDIALSLAALGIRIIAPMPGRGTIGIEVPNQKPEIVSMRSVISSAKFQDSKLELPIALGKTISNESYVVDLTKMPHLLVAGATGQGKSVGLNAILASLLYKKHPAQVKFILVDPKKVELTLYEKIERHFLAKLPETEEAIITNNQEVIHTLASLNVEMDNRYTLLKDAQVRNIKEYNTKFVARRLNPEKGHRFLPYIVLVVDEFADLIMTAGKEIELPIARLAQLARAIGIHLIVATQRPSTNIITGVIKANFPTRVAFKVASMMDSRTILDSPGANQLIGRGDMLITQGSDLVRIQCAFIDTPEIDKITEYIGSQQAYPTAMILPDYETGESDNGSGVNLDKRDDLFEEAARVVVMNQQGSTSLIQRKLSIGYNRAGRIIDQLEAAGIVGAFEGSKARQVLYPDEYSLEKFLNSLN